MNTLYVNQCYVPPDMISSSSDISSRTSCLDTIFVNYTNKEKDD